MQVVEAGPSTKTPGLLFRRTPCGPEQALVNWFLQQDLVRVPRGHRATVFREPRLPSGFPDLVIVIWREAVALHWKPSRASLTATDLRLVHFLTRSGPQTEDVLKAMFSAWREALDRLAEAAMIRKIRRSWRVQSLDTVFAATEIIAVEAKMREWRSALEQAHLNTWFASQSAILVPRIPRGSTLLHDADDLGVTVVAQENPTCALAATDELNPRSYVSWLFNEWAWQMALTAEVR